MRRGIPAAAGPPTGEGGFSLLDGDPLFELQRAARLAGGRHEVLPRALAFAAAGWLPPLLLTVLGGGAHASLLPLHTRFLLAIPVLLWAETFVDVRARAAVTQFTERGIIAPADASHFQAIVSGANHLHRSPRATVTIVLLAFGLSAAQRFFSHTSHLPVVDGWITYLSFPLFRIVLFQWLWRWGLWTMLLVQTSRLALRLEPTHPDLTGGLGFLEQATMAFLSLQVAAGAVLGGRLLMDLGRSDSGVGTVKQEVLAFGLVTIAMTLGPLASFSRKLLLCKQRGQLDYGQLASRHNRLFADRWLGGGGGEPLGDPSISSLADLGTSYGSIDRMRPLPVGRQSLIAMLAVCLVPALPAVLGHVPLQEALKRIVKTVLL
jgi:hypothetical protein